MRPGINLTLHPSLVVSFGTSREEGKREAERRGREGHLLPPSPLSASSLLSLLLFVHDLVVGLDHVIRGGARLLAALRLAAAAGLARSTRRPRSGSLIQRGARCRVGLVQLVQSSTDPIGFTSAKRLSSALECRIQPRLGIGRQPVRPLLAVLLDPVYQAVELVPSLDLLPAVLVFLSVLLGGLHHPIDLGVTETAGGFDPDLLFLTGSLVLGRDVENAVGVDVEG